MKNLLLTMGLAAVVATGASAETLVVDLNKDNWETASSTYDTTVESKVEFLGTKWAAQNMCNTGIYNFNGFAFGRRNAANVNVTASIYSLGAVDADFSEVIVPVTKAVAGGYLLAVKVLVASSADFSDATEFNYSKIDYKYTNWQGTTEDQYEYKADASYNAQGDYTFTVPMNGVSTASKYIKVDYYYTYNASSGANGMCRLLAINFETGGSEVVAPTAPEIKLVEGDYSFHVEMTAEEGAEIYYTTDESDPTTSSTKYTGPVEIWMDTTFKAIAVKDGVASEVTTFAAVPDMITDNFMSLYGFMDDLGDMTLPIIFKGGQFVAAYQYDKYLYVYDNYQYMLFNGDGNYEPGTMFSRLNGDFKVENGLPEVVNYEVVIADGTGTVPQPRQYDDLAYVMSNILNQYIKVDGVKIEQDATTRAGEFYAVDSEGNRVQLANRFDLTLSEMSKADISGFVGIDNGTVQLYPTVIAEDINSGIAAIATDNAQAEYYNLQGVRVSNPENGVYIVRQGNKVNKVVVK